MRWIAARRVRQSSRPGGQREHGRVRPFPRSWSGPEPWRRANIVAPSHWRRLIPKAPLTSFEGAFLAADAPSAERPLRLGSRSSATRRRTGAVSHHRTAAYRYAHSGERDGQDWLRILARARAFALYAALRSLGRKLVELVDSRVPVARRMARRWPGPASACLKTWFLNRCCSRHPAVGRDDPGGPHRPPDRRDPARGVCCVGPTHWQGQPAIRISVSGCSPSMRTSTAPPRDCHPHLNGPQREEADITNTPTDIDQNLANAFGDRLLQI